MDTYILKRRVIKVVLELIVIIIALCTIAPILWIVIMSLKTNNAIFTDTLSLPNPPQWGNYVAALEIMDLPVLIRNTVFVAVTSIGLGMTMVAFSSFAIARMRFGSGKLQNATYVFFLSGTIIPVFVLLYPIYSMSATLKTIDTLWSIILPYIGWTAPISTLILVAAFKAVPSTLDEAAVIDGCNCLQIFYRINVPIIIPSIVTCLIINFLGVWNEYPLSSIMLSSPDKFTTSLAASMFKGLFSVDYAHSAAAIVILTIPQMIIFTFFQRYIVEGISAGAVKG